MSVQKYPRDLLIRTAARATSLVDLMRLLGAPLGSGPCRYLRNRLVFYGIDTAHFVDERLPARSPESYPRERLEEAAAHSTSIRGMLEHMGVAPYDSAYGHLRRKLDRFGIDTAHFTGRRGNGTRPLIPRAELVPAVAASRSLAEVIRVLGRPSGGSGRTLLKRSIEAYGIDVGHFAGQGHGAGRPSPSRRTADHILQRRETGSPRAKTALLRRAMDDVGVPRTCAACGLNDTWQGRRLVLEIDHINGDRLDNRIENLRYLCPSCHSQTVTFSNRRGGAQ
ncbi:HNH endonuclease [Streptomyces sp. NPDC051569]|uniref:HNH endonuclease n=1 Tax=Streptomyces sp. NPDC051569 TaxID=3365661 RepID=UPI003798DACE